MLTEAGAPSPVAALFPCTSPSTSRTRIAPRSSAPEAAGNSRNAPTIDAQPKTFANAFIRPSDPRYGPAILCDFSPVYTVVPGSLKYSPLLTDNNHDLFEWFQGPLKRLSIRCLTSYCFHR